MLEVTSMLSVGDFRGAQPNKMTANCPTAIGQQKAFPQAATTRSPEFL